MHIKLIGNMNNQELEKKVRESGKKILKKKGWMCATDILLDLEILSKENHENWRFGKVRYLEKVCNMNLAKLTLINKTIQRLSNELELNESWTFYKQHGRKGKGKIKLKFSKSGKEDIEKRYATHYIDNKRKNLKADNASV